LDYTKFKKINNLSSIREEEKSFGNNSSNKNIKNYEDSTQNISFGSDNKHPALKNNPFTSTFILSSSCLNKK
jgi:hypothetical protein